MADYKYVTYETLDDGSGVWQYAPGKDKAAWDIAAHRAPDAAEVKADGSYEALSVSWFTTAGHLDGGRSLYLPTGCTSVTQCPTQPPEDGARAWIGGTDVDARAGEIGVDRQRYLGFLARAQKHLAGARIVRIALGSATDNYRFSITAGEGLQPDRDRIRKHRRGREHEL